jgi:hypothetical protein
MIEQYRTSVQLSCLILNSTPIRPYLVFFCQMVAVLVFFSERVFVLNNGKQCIAGVQEFYSSMLKRMVIPLSS